MKKIVLYASVSMMLLLAGASNGMLGQDDEAVVNYSGQKLGDARAKEILNQIKHPELVREIDLGNCEIKSVNELQLNRFVNLQKLDLSGNELEQVNLSQLPQLKYLDLWYNKLQQVDLGQLLQLHGLNLSYNKLQQVVGLSQLTQLKHLDLSNNELQQVDVSQLIQLNKLYLSWNELHQIDVSKLTQLKYLDLSNNELQQVDVSQLTQLQKLYLSDNQLPFNFVIQDSMELEYLDLRDINVKNLQLRNLPKLKTLRIDWNEYLVRLSLLGDVQSVQEITYDRANPNCEVIVEGGRLPNLKTLETDHKELFDHISMPLIHKNKVQQEEVLEDKIFLKENQCVNKKAQRGDLLNKIEQKKEEIAALHKKMYSIEAGVAAVLDQPPVNNPEFEAAKKAREQQEQEAREYREKQEQKEDSEV